MLRRYGLPDHFINLVIRLHADAAVNFKLGDEEVEATSFEFFASLFADDCAVLFESHKDMVIGMDYMYQHFLKCGLEIHLG